MQKVIEPSGGLRARLIEYLPAIVRAVPFAAYMVVLALSPLLGGGGEGPPPLWLYPAQVGLVGLLLLAFWSRYDELTGSWRNALRGSLWVLPVGSAVFVAWIFLDVPVLSLGLSPFQPPRDAAGELVLWWLLVRLAGAAIVVPLMEELFWRSFLMRWIVQADFRAVIPAAVGLRAMLLSSLVFGVEHQLWFAGFVAGLAYAWLYMRSGNLWHAVIAHGVTNLLLGLWVIATGNWQFW